MTLFRQTRANRRAQAQTKSTNEDSAGKTGGYVVLGVNVAPHYQGADESKTTGIPGFEYHWASGLFVGGTDGLVGVQLNATPQLQIGRF